MTNVNSFSKIPLRRLWIGVALAFALPTGAQAGTRDRVTPDIMTDLGPTIFISGDPPTQAAPATVPRSGTARKKPVASSSAKAPSVASAPPAPVVHAHSGPIDITGLMPRAAIRRSAVMASADLPQATSRISVRPRLLFDARRNALPANLLQVDPNNQVPLMRQTVGVDSEYVHRLIGVEVGYSASGSDEKSRFLFDVRTNSLDQETVRAAVGIPIN